MHYFWALKCKTEGCAEQIRVEYIGPWDPSPNPSSLWKHPLYMRCPKCRGIYRYSFYQRRLLETADPPDAFQAWEFG